MIHISRPDGKTVLTWCQRQTRLWDAATGQPKSAPISHEGLSRFFILSPDGKTVLTACEDNSARLWDAATGQLVGKPIPHQGYLSAMAFSPDSKTILTAGRVTGQLWSADIGRPVGQPIKQGLIRAVAFSPDGKTILVTGGSNRAVTLWNAATGELERPPRTLDERVSTASFSPDGKTILTASLNGTARLWDAAGGQTPRQIFRHRREVRVACFNSDGKTVLTASEDGTARLWDTGTGKPIGPALGHPTSVFDAAFSPDGKTIITKANDNHPARLWDISLLPDDLPRIATWVEVFKGLELDEQGDVRVLDNAAWSSRRERLSQMGGPPEMGPEQLFDPIVFGFDPAARGLRLDGPGSLGRCRGGLHRGDSLPAIQRLRTGRARPLPRRPCSGRKSRGRLRASLHPQ